jgi:hypothetical protein
MKHTSVHPWVEELDLWPCLLVFAADKTIALIYTFGGVNGEDLVLGQQLDDRPVRDILTQAQLTRPHSPPAITTARGCVGEVPRALARICFTLSYVTK